MRQPVFSLTICTMLLASPTLAAAQGVPLLCRGGPGMHIGVQSGEPIPSGTTSITVSFKKAKKPGRSAMPRQGECTWADRTLNGQEPQHFRMAASNTLSFNMTGAGSIVTEGGRAQIYCQGNHDKGYCGVVRFILQRKPFIVNVDNDGRILIARSAQFPPTPFIPLPNVQVLGGIANNEVKTGYLPGGATYRAFEFEGQGNVTIDVSITGGRALAFLTDPSFNVITQDDATLAGAADTADARIGYRVPRTSKMFIVFKEKNGTAANFKVRMSFLCDPRTEPHLSYMGSPDQCVTLAIRCRPGEWQFENACGCGCERRLP